MAQFGLIVASVAVVLLGSIATFSMAQIQGLYISETPLPWEEARDHCRSLGKELISIHSESFDRELVQTLAGLELPTELGNLWTSAHELVEGVWIWNATGEPLYHTRWFVGQPDAADQINCFYLAITAHFYWRDAVCTAPFNFICEDPATVHL